MSWALPAALMKSFESWGVYQCVCPSVALPVGEGLCQGQSWGGGQAPFPCLVVPKPRRTLSPPSHNHPHILVTLNEASFVPTLPTCSASPLLVTTQMWMSLEAPLSGDQAVTGLPQGELPGRYFKDRAHTQSSASCDLNLWLCLMGPASLCSALRAVYLGERIFPAFHV